jgi:hypothetical protein
MTDTFQDQKKLRKAQLVTPPNLLKQKTGSGGFDPAALAKAQDALENNKVDFKPIAVPLVALLKETIENVKAGSLKDEAAIESLLYPTMQLRAQGSMFHYPLITEVSDILVNFLETVADIDKDALDIVAAHEMSLNVVLANQLKGAGGLVGKGLCSELREACHRYYKARKG